jgi:hypothetical protein
MDPASQALAQGLRLDKGNTGAVKVPVAQMIPKDFRGAQADHQGLTLLL